MEKKIVFTTVEPNKNLLWLHYKNDQLVLQRFGSNGWEDISNSDHITQTELMELLKDKADLVGGKVPAEQLPDDFGGTIEFKVVDELPAKGEKNTIYLVPNKSEIEENLNDEYIWVNESWEVIGNVSIDLSNYYTKPESDEKFAPSELFFVLPEGTQFPYTLTEEDKKKLEKAKFIIINNNGINYMFNPNSLHDVLDGYWVCINTESYCTRLLIRNNIINSPQPLQLSDYWAVKFSKQIITDAQKQQARTNIGVQSADELLEDADFIAQLKTKLETV